MQPQEIDDDLSIEGFSVESIKSLRLKDEEKSSTNSGCSIAYIFVDKRTFNNDALAKISNYFIESLKDEVIQNPSPSKNIDKKQFDNSAIRKGQIHGSENTANINEPRRSSLFLPKLF